MEGSDFFMRLGVSLAIGLLTGMERSWSQRDAEDVLQPSGIRSFALAGLIGGVAGILGQSQGYAVLAAVFLGFAAIFAAFEWRESAASRELSVTSTLAGLLTFLLGALATVGDMQLAVAGAIAATALLALRDALHAWIAKLTSAEIRDGLILLAMAFLLLPLLPDRPVDPWGLLNLREVWIIATLIAGVSFLGYVAVRSLGPRWGILLMAAAGGLASSTATTLALARLAKGRPAVALLVAGMLVAGGIMLIRVAVIATVLQPALLPHLLPPILAALAVFGLAAVWLSRWRGDGELPDLGIRSPLDLLGALRMAVLIGGVIIVTGLVQRYFGAPGFYSVAAISGLADVDAITISSARMGGDAVMAATAILIAVAANSLAKAALATWIGGTRVGWLIAVPTALALLAGAAARLIW